MKCEACTTSEADPLNDAHWQAGCIGCEARALASIGAHVESLDRRALTPAYHSALERLFGQRWEEGHRLVKAWHERIVSATVGAQVVEAVKQESKAKKRKA